MEPFIGEIRPFAFGIIPKNWAQCNGQLLSTQQNQALFSILGYTYGGNGTTAFALPNLAGRVPLGFAQAYILGITGGETTHALALGEMAPHSHLVTCASSPGSQSVPTGNFPAGTKASNGLAFDTLYSSSANATMAPDVLGLVGSGAAHDNMQPFQVLNFCISLTGVYPSKS